MSEKLGASNFTCGWLRKTEGQVASGPLDYQFDTENDHFVDPNEKLKQVMIIN